MAGKECEEQDRINSTFYARLWIFGNVAWEKLAAPATPAERDTGPLLCIRTAQTLVKNDALQRALSPSLRI